MNKTNIKCPRCYSDKLYKFDLNKQANQKYQCKQCKRQFALGDGDGLPKMNYPKCPKCGKGTYLHHSYKHYNRYKCNNKSCNHIVVKHHTLNIDEASSEAVTGSFSMKGMRFPLHGVIYIREQVIIDKKNHKLIHSKILKTDTAFRDVSIPQTLCNILTQHKSEQPQGNEKGFVILDREITCVILVTCLWTSQRRLQSISML